jgi:ferredoxin
MTHVITSLCIRDGACVEVCPVECIVPGPRDDPEWPLFYIDPDTCIDCGACVPECPVEAIFPEEDVPEQFAHEAVLNERFFSDGPGYWDYDLDEERVREGT